MFSKIRSASFVPQPLGRHVFGPLGRFWPRSPKLPQPLRAGTLLQNVGGDWLDAYIHSMARIPEERARSLLRAETTGRGASSRKLRSSRSKGSAP